MSISLARDAAAIWSAGLGIGVATLRREPMLGLKRILLPSSYWRTAEFAYVCRNLSVGPGSRVLDLGSPKDLAAIVARRFGAHVAATDILPEAIELSARYTRAQGIAGSGAGQVQSEIQDGRALTYEDGAFDAAFSVSVLEHIPDEGDGAALQELVRVVRPGGRVIVTTPYAREARDTFVERKVYDRAMTDGKPVFFERHYDAATLRTRLLDRIDAECTSLEIWGEAGLRGERLLSRAGKLRALLSPLEGALSAVSLRPLPPGTGHPMAAFFTVQKSVNKP